ncbi:MAG: metallophosphoesterase [Flavobacteriaceae bacterium]|nr:metallophosphoesterase [Flavobacteriaceae bacterium]
MNSRLIVFFCFLMALDVYTFYGLKTLVTRFENQRLWRYSYFLLIIIAYIGTVFLINYFVKKPLHISVLRNLIIGFAFSFIIFKILFSLFLLIDDFSRILGFATNNLAKLIGNPKDVTYPQRRKFIGQIGLGLAAIPFLSMLYGITKGKYNYKVKHIKLKLKNLPKAFDGFKLVHISDIHSGSFDSIEDVQRGIDLINEQNADLICFTGDLVNNDSREIAPFISDFKKLKSKYGLFSSLGNHDYGDYKKWPSEQAKKDNLALLFKHHKEIGFKLLNNEAAYINKDGEKLAIVGVENWGKPPFPQHGNLDKALEKIEETDFKILLSHDPTHWDYKVLKHPTFIDLTLSGHTHGMQFGIEIPGFKWSPIKYFYPRWAGLYQEKQQFLYVNRGFGFLGFPGRVGIWPEITSIELTAV